MLAVKLHKTPRPLISKGSYLVPLLNWETGRIFVRNWVRMLNHCNSGMPNNKIHYITLVRVPGSFPVTLNGDWIFHDDNYLPWKTISKEDKDWYAQWQDPEPFDENPMRGRSPQLILGGSLPKNCVLWTKNARLLFRGNLKANRCKRSRDQTSDDF